MSKVTFSTFNSLENETSFLTTLNNNFANVSTAIDLLLSRNGTAPNTMTANIDMNSHRIINLPTPVASGEPVRKQELDDLGLITYDNLQAAIDAAADIDTALVEAQAAAVAAAASAAESASYVGAAVSAPKWSTPRTLSYTGDVTGSLLSVDGSVNVSGALTIANSSVTTAKVADSAITNAKLANVSTGTFKGRTSASTGAVEDMTATQATALLNNVVGDSGSGGTKGLVPAPAAGDAAAGKFLKASGVWAAPTVANPDLADLSSSTESLTSSTGYSLIGNLMIQCGTYNTGVNGSVAQTITFPTAFPNACISFVPVSHNTGASPNTQDTYIQVTSKNTYQAVVYLQNNNGGFAVSIDWIAIGY